MQQIIRYHRIQKLLEISCQIQALINKFIIVLLEGQGGVVQLEIHQTQQKSKFNNSISKNKLHQDDQSELNDRDDLYNQTIAPEVDNREEEILKLQDINEKFRIRVVELEQIVQQALERSQNYLQEAKQKGIATHRDILKGETPEIQNRNLQLKNMQQHIKNQQREINSLKNRLEALDSMSKLADVENKVLDMERQNKEARKQQNVLVQINNDQMKALSMLTQDTEYEEQTNQLKRDITKWKDKYQMLKQYKKEEDLAFKHKFEQFVDVNQERHKIKQNIIDVKYNSSNNRGSANVEETARSKSNIPKVGKTMGRSVSQARLRNNPNDFDNLVKSKNAIEKVLNQHQRQFNMNKKDMLKQEAYLKEEIENLILQIVNTDQMNKLTIEELKQLQALYQEQQIQQNSFIQHIRQSKSSSQQRLLQNNSLQQQLNTPNKHHRVLRNAKISYQGSTSNLHSNNDNITISRLGQHQTQKSYGNLRNIQEESNQQKGYGTDHDATTNNQSFLNKIQQQQQRVLPTNKSLKPVSSSLNLIKTKQLQEQLPNRYDEPSQSPPKKELLSDATKQQMNQYLNKQSMMQQIDNSKNTNTNKDNNKNGQNDLKSNSIIKPPRK